MWPEKVWKFLAESHNSRKHKVHFYDSLQICFYVYKLWVYVLIPVQICTKADQ